MPLQVLQKLFEQLLSHFRAGLHIHHPCQTRAARMPLRIGPSKRRPTVLSSQQTLIFADGGRMSNHLVWERFCWFDSQVRAGKYPNASHLADIICQKNDRG